MQVRRETLTEEDEALLALVSVCVLFSVFLPLALFISPEVIKEALVLVSVVVISLFGPVFSLREMRFLLCDTN